MPELTPTGAVDVVERQVRRVRRRKNLYELQRAVYLAIVASGVAAILLLPLALFARASLFGATAWSTLLALVIAAAALVRDVARRRIARADSVAWVESHAALGGRVRTLLELGREPTTAAGFFHPLLVSEVAATLGAWSPSRLVPRRVPRGALASALAVAAVLAFVLRMASLAAPPPSAVALDDRGGIEAERAETPAGASDADDRIVTSPRTRAGGTARRSTDAAPAGDSALTRLSSALQDAAREQVWGKAWERIRDEALARAGADAAMESDRDGDDDAHGEELDAEGSDDRALAKGRRALGQGRKGRTGDADADAQANDDATKRAQSAQADTGERRDGGGAPGAGNSTSPGDLFNGSSVDTAATNTSFELSLAARMRSDAAGRRRPGGTAPDADPDARPALGADQRREAAAHRMAVPAAYEQVVREVFAHREEP